MLSLDLASAHTRGPPPEERGPRLFPRSPVLPVTNAGNLADVRMLFR
jgi:hypothetical protein